MYSFLSIGLLKSAAICVCVCVWVVVNLKNSKGGGVCVCMCVVRVNRVKLVNIETMKNDTSSVFVVVNDKVASSLRNQQTSLIELLQRRCLTNANIHKQQYSHADTIRKG